MKREMKEESLSLPSFFMPFWAGNNAIRGMGYGVVGTYPRLAVL